MRKIKIVEIEKKFYSIEKPQSFLFRSGVYLVELYGAQGGIGREDGFHGKAGGLGARVSLVMRFYQSIELFMFIGSKGSDGRSQANTEAKGGWNGGGNGGIDTNDNDGSGAGGGSTDLRWINSEDEEGIRSRIAVAAGGSGSAFAAFGAPGGDQHVYYTSSIYDPYGFVRKSEKPSLSKYKLFKGENGRSHTGTPSSGAGGGYYGGYTVDGGDHASNYPMVGTRGTSYVAGCEGDDEATNFLKNHGIEILNWTMVPGLPSKKWQCR